MKKKEKKKASVNGGYRSSFNGLELICIKGLDFFPKALILERQGKRTEVGKLGEE